MKLSKKTWIILVIGILIIAFANLSMTYSRQGKEQSRLDQELSLVQLTLATYSPEELSSQQRELESQLAQAESELEDAKAHLRQSIESIEVTDTLFEVAQTWEVEIIDLRSSGSDHRGFRRGYLLCSVAHGQG